MAEATAQTDEESKDAIFDKLSGTQKSAILMKQYLQMTKKLLLPLDVI